MTSPKQSEKSLQSSPATPTILPGDQDEIPANQSEFSFVGEYYQGPAPPPQILEAYSRIDASFPNRLLEMTEREQQHRHQQECKEQEAGFALARRAQYCAASIALLAIIAAVPIAIWGNEWAAGFIGVGGVIAPLVPALFPSGKKKKDADE